MSTACCARAPQRCTSRTYMPFLLMFPEVRPIRKTRNQSTPTRRAGGLRMPPFRGALGWHAPVRGAVVGCPRQRALGWHAPTGGAMAGCPLRGHCWRMPPQGAEARPGPALCLGFPDCRGAKSPHASGSARFSCSSCLRLSCRTTASSQPTVLTPYPLAQQCSPVQLRVRPRYARWEA
jgi:hypothetical protein